MRDEGRFHRIATATLAVLGAALAAGTIVLWSWNTLAVELFAAPAMQFKHALALVLMVAIAPAATVAAARIGRRRGEGSAS